MDSVYVFILFSLFVIGAVVGSFLNVCIHRFPQHESVGGAWRGLLYPPSHCPGCRTPIRWYDNVPIVGWLWLRGRCRSCRMPISFRYPAVELLTAILFVVVFMAEVPFGAITKSCLYHPLGPLGESGFVPWPGMPARPVTVWPPASAPFHNVLMLRYVFHLVLVIALIVATFIDFDLMIIPDSVTRPATIVGIVGNTALGCVHLVPVWYAIPGGLNFASIYSTFAGTSQAPAWIPAPVWSAMVATAPPQWTVSHPHWHGLAVSLAGLVVGALTVWIVRVVGFWALKREAMGDGDIYLMAMIGSFLGWQATIAIFFLAPLCALAVAILMLPFRRAREIPYGPYLSLATLLVLLGFRYVWPPFEGSIFSLGPLLPLLAFVMIPSLGLLLVGSRIVLRAMGFETGEPEPVGEWGPGDQLAYQAMERVDEQQNTWRTDQWPGVRTGRGQDSVLRWRRGLNGESWRRNFGVRR